MKPKEDNSTSVLLVSPLETGGIFFVSLLTVFLVTSGYEWKITWDRFYHSVIN